MSDEIAVIKSKNDVRIIDMGKESSGYRKKFVRIVAKDKDKRDSVDIYKDDLETISAILDNQ